MLQKSIIVEVSVYSDSRMKHVITTVLCSTNCTIAVNLIMLSADSHRIISGHVYCCSAACFAVPRCTSFDFLGQFVSGGCSAQTTLLSVNHAVNMSIEQMKHIWGVFWAKE